MIIGSDGFITKTTDAGVQWLKQNSGSTAYLKSVFFVSLNIGWVAGEGGLILKTTDSGASWFKQNSGTSEILNDINFSDVNIGWVVGYNGIILKTTNGGGDWTQLTIPDIDRLMSVDFVNSLIGFAAGSRGEYGPPVLLKTTDGGLEWVDRSTSFISKNEINYLLCVEFINEDVGWVGSGMDQFIFKTTDGGDSWYGCGLISSNQKIVESLPIEPGGVRDIYFKDENIGFAVGGERTYHRKIYATSDGGLNWYIKYEAQEEYDLISVYGTKAGKGWAIGSNGTIFITDNNGQSWAQQLSGGVLPSGKDNIKSIYFIDDQIGWIAGDRDNFIGGSGSALILKTTNGGKIWESKYYLYSNENYISCIYFKNDSIGWSNSVSNELDAGLKSTDGGETWELTNLFFNSMIFIDENTGWTAGNSIMKTTDGGETWLEKSSIGGSSVYFADEFTGWVAGSNGNILKTIDGGETWVCKTSGTTRDLTSIKFYQSNIGFCVGKEGTILSSTNGGETWISKNWNSSENLNSISITNSTTSWIAGDNGTVLHSSDLGNTWAINNQLTTNSLESIFFIDENTGWVSGLSGTMFKYKKEIAIPVEMISFSAVIQNKQVKLNWTTATELNNSGFDVERKICSGQSLTGNFERIGFVKGAGTISESKNYSFTDKNLINSKYVYRLKQIDLDGTINYSNEIEVNLVPPIDYLLAQNYPNPFNPITKIRYQLPQESKVVIKVYDVLGAEVMELLSEQKEAGVYEVEFNAEGLSSGTYIYKISADNFVQTKKMILLK